MNNKFIIITPSYNNENWVETYIDSILTQTYTNYEVIYINDNSSDNTESEIVSRITHNPKFTYIKNTSNLGAFKNYIIGHEKCYEDNDIIINLDGDDWFATPTVLEQLNEVYNKYDYWVTYGKMLVYLEDGLCEPFPQNSLHDQFIHKHSFYRRDTWRSSHLRTYRNFLYKMIDKQDFVSKINNELYWHAADLSLMFPLLEMSPIEKIGAIQFPTCVYNASKINSSRTRERENVTNIKFEAEIRNKKTYVRVNSKKNLSIGKKLPQVNIIGDYRERNNIPTKCTFVYNQLDGEFDISVIQDTDILKVISGETKINRGKLIADVHEPPYLFNQSEVYSKLMENSEKFDVILTNHPVLLTLPNSEFRNSGYEVVLNKNIHKQTYPILQDNSLMKLYDKSKMVSFISSNKTFTTGHLFRIECLNHVNLNKRDVDIFGVGIREIVGKIEALKDYRFSITMENGQYENYFTEKILDCFLTGTIPIYHGCPNIDQFFNIEGFYIFNTVDELLSILNSLTEKDYTDRLQLIKENFNLANNWWLDNDRFFEKYIKKLI
jgi:glycosyltransferase involved in cell wall biosynthesis